MSPSRGDAKLPPLRGLIGAPPERLLDRLPAAADRRAGDDRWLLFHAGGAALRVRVERRGVEERVASWTLTFGTDLPRSLAEAARRAGLWPELGPEERAGEGTGIIRRALPSPEGGAVCSATAAYRAGGIVRLAAFDEPPEWEEDAGRG